jgi:hypothetical protein
MSLQAGLDQVQGRDAHVVSQKKKWLPLPTEGERKPETSAVSKG